MTEVDNTSASGSDGTSPVAEKPPTQDPSDPAQDPRFLERVAALPIVTSTIGQLAHIYQCTKGTNPYVKYTLETAEAGVKSVTQTAMPVMQKFERPIGAIDSIACSQLDKLEEKFPIVTKPTGEVVEESKKVYEKTMKPSVDVVSGMASSAANSVGAAKQYTVDTVNAVKEYSNTKVSDAKNYTCEKVVSTASYGKDKIDQALETTSGQAVLSRVGQALDKTEEYVEYYLPEEKTNGKEELNDSGEEPKEPVDADNKSEESTVDLAPVKPTDMAFGKLVNVSDKLRRRMYAKTLRELQHVKKRSQETLERLTFTVDLIEYAKNNIDGAKSRASSAKDKFISVWEEINKEEEIEMSDFSAEKNGDFTETEKGAETRDLSHMTLEKRAIVTAAHLTSQLKRGFGAMTSTVYVLPLALQNKINDAKTFTDSLYTNFANAKTLEDIPNTLISQTRTQVVHLQGTLSSYTDYIRNNYFGSWLGTQALEDLEVEEESKEEADKEDTKREAESASSSNANMAASKKE